MKSIFALKASAAVLVLALASAAHAVAAVPTLTAEPTVVNVSTDSFTSYFNVNISGPSSFSGSLASVAGGYAPYFSYSALDILSVSMNAAGFNSAVSGNGATFSVASLAAGNYTLTVTGKAFDAVGLGVPPGVKYGSYSIVGNVAAVPEPESYAMLLAGLGIIGAIAKRRARKA